MGEAPEPVAKDHDLRVPREVATTPSAQPRLRDERQETEAQSQPGILPSLGDRRSRAESG